MIEETRILVLTDGQRVSLPLTEDAAKSIYTITIIVSPITIDGAKVGSFGWNVPLKELHITKEALGVSLLQEPTQKAVSDSVEDRLIELLEELGVRFEE
jgi:hypothetical protein